MKTHKLKNYLTPLIGVDYLTLEQGIAASDAVSAEINMIDDIEEGRVW